MQQFIPLKKQQKKAQRVFLSKQRGSWGALNPITRKPANPKAYNRKKARKWSDESPLSVPFLERSKTQILRMANWPPLQEMCSIWSAHHTM